MSVENKNGLITLDTIKELGNCIPIIYDTETSGFIGCPSYHKSHKLLQICGISLFDNDVFEHYIDHGENFKVCNESSKLHGITNEILKKKGLPLEEVMKKFHDWNMEKMALFSDGGKKKILGLAHCAKFDRDVILKSFKNNFGKEGIELPITWLDTCECARLVFPEIKDNAYAKEYQGPQFKGQPYKLQSLMYHFYKRADGDFHNALFDCKQLAKLFIEKILPKIWNQFISKSWETSIPGIIIPIESPIYDVKPVILTPLSKVKFLKKTCIPRIVELLNEYFSHHVQGDNKFEVNEAMVSVAHLFLYGWREYNRSLSKLSLHDTSRRDIWANIIYHVEFFLRDEIGIYSDDSLCEIFALMTNRTPCELYNNTFVEGTNTPVFPSMPGCIASYYPFHFDEETAKLLYVKLGIKTAHDLYINYMLNKDNTNMRGWVNMILGVLNVNARKAFDQDICNGNFKLIIPNFTT